MPAYADGYTFKQMEKTRNKPTALLERGSQK